MHRYTLKTAKTLGLIALACLAAACGDDDSSADNNATNNAPNNTTGTNNPSNNTTGTNNPSNNLPHIDALGSFVAADYSASGYGGFRTGFEQITTQDFGTGDVVVAVGAANAYAIDRGAGIVRILDPTTDFATVGTIEIQEAADPAYTLNPQTVVEAGGALWIPLLGSGDVVSYTEEEGAFIAGRTLDLEATFDDGSGDGNLDPAPLIAVGDTLMVGVQYLDATFAPAQPGALILADATTGEFIDADTTTTAVDPLVLPFLNPSELQASPTGAVGVGLVGIYGELDGGIVLVEPTAAGGWVVGDTLVTETDLGGHLSSFVLVDDTSGYAIVSALDFSRSSLVHFEKEGAEATVTAIDAILDASGLAITADRGFLVVGDRGEVIDEMRVGDGVIQLRTANDGVAWGRASAGLLPSSLAIVE